jgi:hypothetical protein
MANEAIRQPKNGPTVFGRRLVLTHCVGARGTAKSPNVWQLTVGNVSVFMRDYGKREGWAWSCACLPQRCDDASSGIRQIEARMRELTEAFGPLVGWAPKEKSDGE